MGATHAVDIEGKIIVIVRADRHHWVMAGLESHTYESQWCCQSLFVASSLMVERRLFFHHPTASSNHWLG